MKLHYNWRSMLAGGLIYAIGDTIAALILDRFGLPRLLGMTALGATVYAFEIPNYFRWIDRRTSAEIAPRLRALKRTFLALLYFNPLWIARHLFFIHLFSQGLEGTSWDLLRIGFLSWLVNIPISMVGNYLIQVRIPLRWRFPASAIFSGILAIYYSLSEALF